MIVSKKVYRRARTMTPPIPTNPNIYRTRCDLPCQTELVTQRSLAGGITENPLSIFSGRHCFASYCKLNRYKMNLNNILERGNDFEKHFWKIGYSFMALWHNCKYRQEFTTLQTLPSNKRFTFSNNCTKRFTFSNTANKGDHRNNHLMLKTTCSALTHATSTH